VINILNVMKEAKKIVEKYNVSLQKAEKDNYRLAIPISFLNNSKLEIKDAIRRLVIESRVNDTLNQKTVENLKNGYISLAFFVSDSHANTLKKQISFKEDKVQINILERKSEFLDSPENVIRTRANIERDLKN